MLFSVPLPQFCSRLFRVWVGLCWSRARPALGEPTGTVWASLDSERSLSSAYHSLLLAALCPRQCSARLFTRGTSQLGKRKQCPSQEGVVSGVSGLSWVGRGRPRGWAPWALIQVPGTHLHLEPHTEAVWAGHSLCSCQQADAPGRLRSRLGAHASLWALRVPALSGGLHSPPRLHRSTPFFCAKALDA